MKRGKGVGTTESRVLHVPGDVVLGFGVVINAGFPEVGSVPIIIGIVLNIFNERVPGIGGFVPEGIPMGEHSVAFFHILEPRGCVGGDEGTGRGFPGGGLERLFVEITLVFPDAFKSGIFILSYSGTGSGIIPHDGPFQRISAGNIGVHGKRRMTIRFF